MNIASYSGFGYKEFASIQANRVDASSQQRSGVFGSRYQSTSASRTQFRESSETSVSTGFRNMRDTADVRSLMGRHSVARNQYSQGGNQFQSRSKDVVKSDTGNQMQLDTASTSRNRQSTELQIRTKDGDVVTLTIKEKSLSKESSSVSVKESDSDQGGASASVQMSQSDRSKEYASLSGIFDGDSVSDVDYTQKWASHSQTQMNVMTEEGGVATQASLNTSEHTRGRLEFEVDGDLDAEELAAIQDLVEGVNELSDLFFDGNLTEAFDAATQLGYDSDEIAGYSLELKNREVSVEEQSYQQVKQLTEPEPPKGIFGQMGSFNQRLMGMMGVDQQQFEGQVLNQLFDVREESDDDESNIAEEDVQGSVSGYRSFSQFSQYMMQAIERTVFQIRS